MSSDLTRSGHRSAIVAAASIGVAVGTLLGAVVWSFAPRSPSISDRPRDEAVQPADPRIDDALNRIARIENSLTALSNAADARPVRAETPPERATERALDSATERAPTSSDAARKSSGASDSFGWVTVLDPAIARMLVERGLTPYDPGVGVLISAAGSACRAAQDEANVQFKILSDQSSKRLIEYDQYLLAHDAANTRLRQARQSVLDKLGADLDALIRSERKTSD